MSVEPTPRRVRVEFGGQTIADSKRVILFRWSRGTPTYYFPRADVRADFLIPTSSTAEDPLKGVAHFSDVVVGNRTAEQGAFTYADPVPEWPGRPDYVAFAWEKMDRWLEETEEVIKHPRDPYHRVDVAQSDRHVRVVVGGQTIADTTRPKLLFETQMPTRYYIPQDDIRMDLLEPVPDLKTSCPYKGEASYWKVKGAVQEIAWAYLAPLPECPKIAGLISFYNERVDEVHVDDEPEPKPLPRWHSMRARL
ncbi:MAG: DUF427 domain-containing protein [Chloroflexi bacterium]|nr:DUF427 domain-containing protein [Chloroflexota bacterium]